MSGHTAGRWIARHDPAGSPGDWCIGLDDDVSPIDYVAVCNKRDARLIAAAPGLLEALREIAEASDPDLGGVLSEAWVHSCAVAAIAKATGEGK